MTDDARLNPRPLVLDGLPTRRGLIRAAHALLADNTDESTEASNALRTLADRLPALLGAVEEARRWREVVAETEMQEISDGEGDVLPWCPFCCQKSPIWYHPIPHTPDCPHVAAVAECKRHSDTGGGA